VVRRRRDRSTAGRPGPPGPVAPRPAGHPLRARPLRRRARPPAAPVTAVVGREARWTWLVSPGRGPLVTTVAGRDLGGATEVAPPPRGGVAS